MKKEPPKPVDSVTVQADHTFISVIPVVSIVHIVLPLISIPVSVMSGTGLMLDGWPDSPRTSDDFFGRRRKSNRFEPPKHLFCQTATRQQPSPLPSQRPRMATYSGTPRARPSLRNLASSTFSTTTPTMTRTTGGGGDIEVGDKVSVPGGMDGTVKFVGEIRGKQGSFVGVELSRQWAARGKNDGNVDGYVRENCMEAFNSPHKPSMPCLAVL